MDNYLNKKKKAIARYPMPFSFLLCLSSSIRLLSFFGPVFQKILQMTSFSQLMHHLSTFFVENQSLALCSSCKISDGSQLIKATEVVWRYSVAIWLARTKRASPKIGESKVEKSKALKKITPRCYACRISPPGLGCVRVVCVFFVCMLSIM